MNHSSSFNGFASKILLALLVVNLFPQQLVHFDVAKAAPLFADGDGSQGNPYQISTCLQLQNMRDPNVNYSGQYFKMTQDIDCSATGISDTNSPNYDNDLYHDGAGFNAIGYYDNGYHLFDGTFDGGGHTISHLTINDSGISYVGLFGFVGGAKISNLNLTDENVTGSSNTGGLIGYGFVDSSSTMVSNVSVSGTIHGGNNGSGLLVGGLEFNNDSVPSVPIISKSSTSGTIYSSGSAGGLVGGTYGSVIINDSYSTATIYGTVVSTQNLGGLVGNAQRIWNSTNKQSVIINNSYWAGTISGDPGTDGATAFVPGGLIGTYQESVHGNNVKNSFSAGTLSGNAPGSIIGVLADEGVSLDDDAATFLSTDYNSTGVPCVGETPNDTSYGCQVPVGGNTDWQGSNSHTIAPLSSWDFDTIWKTTGGYPEIKVPAVLREVTPVPAHFSDWLNVNPPSYTFNSDQAGTGSFGGSCAAQSPTTFSVTVGNNTVEVDTVHAEGNYSDCTVIVTNENGSSVLNMSAFAIDHTAPNPVISLHAITSPTSQNPVPFVVETFNGDSDNHEAVTGFDGTDITVTGGTLQNFVNVAPGSYTFDVVPTLPEGENSVQISVNIALGKFTDLAGNNNTAATQFTATYQSLFAGGTGVEGDPYLIANCQQLQNAGGGDYSDSYFKLTQDIDCLATRLDSNNTLPEGDNSVPNTAGVPNDHASNTDHQYNNGLYHDGAGFQPISEFYGVFDGDGHTISNLYINRSETQDVGLFSYISEDNITGEVKNLQLDNAHVVGNGVVGAIVGEAETASIHDVTLTNAHVEGNSSEVGGIAGYASNLDMHNVSVSGTVKINGEAGACGGLIGNVDPTTNIYNSKFSGTVDASVCSQVGGLVGYGSVNVYQSFSEGTINGYDDVGGLIGKLNYNQNTENPNSVSDSYSTATVNGTHQYIGGLIGHDVSTTVQRTYATGAVGANNAINVAGLIGYLEDGNYENTYDVKDSYATGVVTADSFGYGLIGNFGGAAANLTFSTDYWDDNSGQTECVPSGENGCQNHKITSMQAGDQHNYWFNVVNPPYVNDGDSWNFAGTWFTNGSEYPILASFAAPLATITYSPVDNYYAYKSGDVVTITADFDRPLADFPLPQIAISGSNTQEAVDMIQQTTQEYTYQYTVGAGDGLATVTLSKGKGTGGVDINGTPISGATFIIDNTPPTTTISSESVSNGGSTTLTAVPFRVHFSDFMRSGFNANNIIATNATITGFAGINNITSPGHRDFIFNVNPIVAGQVTLNVAHAAAKDWAGNDNIAATQYSFNYQPSSGGGIPISFISNGGGSSGGVGGGSSGGPTNSGTQQTQNNQTTQQTQGNGNGTDKAVCPKITVVGDEPFTDAVGHWAHDCIIALYNNKVVTGRAPHLYVPDGTLTRAEAVKIGLLAFGYKLDVTTPSGFTDLNSNGWYVPYLRKAKALGVISGTTFHPNDPITRADALEIYLKMAKKLDQEAAAPFTDVDQKAEYAPYVNYAYAKGVVKGRTSTTFVPNGTITRGEIAKIVLLIKAL